MKRFVTAFVIALAAASSGCQEPGLDTQLAVGPDAGSAHDCLEESDRGTLALLPFEETLLPARHAGWAWQSSEDGDGEQGWGRRLDLPTLLDPADEIDALLVMRYDPSLPVETPSWGSDLYFTLCQRWPFCSILPGSGPGAAEPGAIAMMPPGRGQARTYRAYERVPERIKRERRDLTLVRQDAAGEREPARVREIATVKERDIIRRARDLRDAAKRRSDAADPLLYDRTVVGSGPAAMGAHADAVVGELDRALWANIVREGSTPTVFQNAEQMNLFGIDMAVYVPGTGARDLLPPTAFWMHNLDLAMAQLRTGDILHGEAATVSLVRGGRNPWLWKVEYGAGRDAAFHHTNVVELALGQSRTLLPATARAAAALVHRGSDLQQFGRWPDVPRDAAFTIDILGGGPAAADLTRVVATKFPRANFPDLVIRVTGNAPRDGKYENATIPGFDSVKTQYIDRDSRIRFLAYGDRGHFTGRAVPTGTEITIDRGQAVIPVDREGGGRETLRSDFVISALGPEATIPPLVARALREVPNYRLKVVWIKENLPYPTKALPVALEVWSGGERSAFTGLRLTGAVARNRSILEQLGAQDAAELRRVNETLSEFLQTASSASDPNSMAAASSLADVLGMWASNDRNFTRQDGP